MPATKPAGRASFGPLLEGGVKIFEYQPTMFHPKTMVVDGIFSTVGSANFDDRSFHLNEEINLFVYDGGIVPDPDGLITAGHDNQTARTIGFRRDGPIRSEAIVTFLRHLVADNRAGGWRRIKAAGPR